MQSKEKFGLLNTNVLVRRKDFLRKFVRIVAVVVAEQLILKFVKLQIKLIKMSFSITPSDTIRNHPTNTSTSKQVHQFAKTPRFLSNNPECPNAFYSYDSQLSNRKAAFGYGNKSDFTQTTTISPPVTSYMIKSFVEQTKTRGKSFGTARDKMPDRSYLIPQVQKIPGPGAYENQKQKLKNYSFTTRPKPVDFIEAKLTYKEAPGPGAHKDLNMQPNKGRFSVSKYTDAPLSIINPKTERFATIKQSPGPSTYVQGDAINGEGKYVLSNRKSNGRRVFSKSARDGYWKGKQTPGPGSYVETTEFGHYGNSQYYKTLNK